MGGATPSALRPTDVTFRPSQRDQPEVRFVLSVLLTQRTRATAEMLVESKKITFSFMRKYFHYCWDYC